MVHAIFTNYIIKASVIAWALAQLIKTALNFVSERKFSAERLIGSGGMPSSHAAFVTSMAVATGRYCGFASANFALAFGIAMIVMYDAMGVRRETGEQARVINRIQDSLSENIDPSEIKQLKELVGHTPLEVIGGAITGLAVAVLLKIK